MSQAPERAGATDDKARYEPLGLRVVDLTYIDDAAVPHLVAFTSPTVLDMLRRIVAGG